MRTDEEVRDLIWEQAKPKFQEQIEMCAEDEIHPDVLYLLEVLTKVGDKNPEQRDTLLRTMKAMVIKLPNYRFFRDYPISAGHGL